VEGDLTATTVRPGRRPVELGHVVQAPLAGTETALLPLARGLKPAASMVAAMTPHPDIPSPRRGHVPVAHPVGRAARATLSPRARDDDASLLLAARAGDQHVWKLLIGRYNATIKGIARRHRLSAADQEDVAQRTWLRLVEHIEAVREPAAVGGWLVAVARNECLRLLAMSAREVPVDEPRNADAADATTIEDEIIEAARKQALHAALDGLPAHQRRLLRTLVEEPGLNYNEISARLGIPRGSIGPTRARGLVRLRQDAHFASAIDGHVDRRTPSRRNHDLT
jgi:RNA polymerase sigma factor (sigma-70 family)